MPQRGRANARLIPARAGNINTARPARRRWPAHPRSRGEHHGGAICRSSSRGSSPLARGTFGCVLLWSVSRRLIPARAGNMGESMVSTSPIAAHPRSRGEHWRKTAVHELASGSSPLARGTSVAGAYVPMWFRLIPARAGNILSAARRCLTRTAHPRSRGEHRRCLASIAVASGSSPLARGTWRSPPYARFPMRLIPARAGNMYGKIV